MLGHTVHKFQFFVCVINCRFHEIVPNDVIMILIINPALRMWRFEQHISLWLVVCEILVSQSAPKIDVAFFYSKLAIDTCLLWSDGIDSPVWEKWWQKGQIVIDGWVLKSLSRTFHINSKKFSEICNPPRDFEETWSIRCNYFGK